MRVGEIGDLEKNIKEVDDSILQDLMNMRVAPELRTLVKIEVLYVD